MKDSAIRTRTIRAYYRLAKPGIVYGNLIAAIAGFLLASKGTFDVTLFVATMLGISLVMAAACALNNYTDQSIDAKMNRTKRRPLVTGEVSALGALVFSAVLVLLGFGLLVAFTNWLTVIIGLIGLLDYVVFYAYAKRTSVHGTLVGTVSGAAPPVAAYVAVTNQLDLGAALLFVVMVVWQMAHFYAIAMMSAKDYKAASIPVMPVIRGMQATKRHTLFYIALFMCAVVALPFFGYDSYIAEAILLATGLGWLLTAYYWYNRLDDIAWARKVFGYSLITLLLFSAVISMVNILP